MTLSRYTRCPACGSPAELLVHVHCTRNECRWYDPETAWAWAMGTLREPGAGAGAGKELEPARDEDACAADDAA